MKTGTRFRGFRIVAAGLPLLPLLALMLPAKGSTQSQATIVGNHPAGVLAGDWEAVSADLPLHMTAVLSLRNLDEFKALKTELQQPGSPNYHRWLSSEEFASRFGPTRDQMRAVTDWLSASGFTIDSSDLRTRTVRFSGPAGQVEQVMGIRIVGQGSLYANLDDPQIPSALAQSIVAVFGLSNLGVSPPNAVSSAKQGEGAPSSTSLNKYLTPSDFYSFYDESTPSATPSADCIAVLEVGVIPTPAPASPLPTASPSPTPCTGSGPPQQVAEFTKAFSLPGVDLTIIPTDQNQCPPYATDLEPQLDVEWAHAVAPNYPIRFYVSSISDTVAADFDTLSLAVDQNVCGVISSSIDSHGTNCPDLAEIQAFGQVSAQAVAQGQTFFHSSGDYGSYYPCGQPTTTLTQTDVQPSIEESYANEDVTVVGGTQFTYPTGGATPLPTLAPGVEYVWNNPVPTPSPSATPVRGTSGGGVSVVWPAPSWQATIIPFGMTTPLKMRGVPDVSIVASSTNPGLYVTDTDPTICQDLPVCFVNSGGTSVSSPIWAGISRLVAQQLKTTRLGNINPQLYQIYETSVANGCQNSQTNCPLVDVLNPGTNCPYGEGGCGEGANATAYEVGPDYDLGTGLGSPDIDKLVAAFPPSPTATPTVSVTLVLRPKKLSFGAVKLGKSKSMKVQVSYPTGKKYSSGPTVTIDHVSTTPNFPISNNCPATLAPGGKCQITVTFFPTYAAKVSGTLSIFDNVPGAPQTVPLAGKGK
ncbi:MAG: protease pro-enzyme activation domain-containing protein [Candidatus Binataceae bacterium]